MVDTSLVSYINQLLQSGYDINTIRDKLASSGYDINAVNEAVNYIYQGSGEHAPKASFLVHLKSKKFIIAFSGILLLIILSLIILTFAGGESLPIELFATPLSSEVSPGEELTFTKSVLNLEGTGMLSLSYGITNSEGGVIASSQEKVSAQSVPRSTTLSIPADTPPGSYLMKAVARFGEQQSEAVFSFTIVAVQEETAPEEETPPSEPAAEEPDNDNDGIPDSEDPDDDNDGIPDADDANPVDHDNDGIPDSSDTDDDNDGILDKFDYYLFDRDNDGIPDEEDADNDNDGIEDAEDEYPFDYDNDGLGDMEDDDKSYEVPSSQSEGVSFACSADIDCNDFDVCSTDSCAEGTCEYETISPCCGNFVCESGEDSSGCPQDCTEAVSSVDPVDDVVADIIAGAATNPEAAALQCDEIPRQSVADRCYFELAKATPNSAFCDLIAGEKIKDSCYIYFVINLEEFNLCDNVANRYLRNSCYSIEVASTS